MIGLYYALGGGLGHGLRELALAREMARVGGGRHVLLVNSPFGETLRAAVDRTDVELRWLRPAASPEEAGQWVIRQRDELQPDLLVVDTFPRGLGGELAEWLPGWKAGLKVLVSRVLPDAYVRQFQLAEFSAATFDLMFAPGEPGWLPGETVSVIRTEPWLVRRAEELFAPDSAAERLGCARHERCVLVVGTGTLVECREWIEWFRELASRWSADGPPLRLALPKEIAGPDDLPARMIVRHVPLVELLPGAAVVVGSAGYHLVQETRGLGLPARFVARRRLYDEQRGRLREPERVANMTELMNVLLNKSYWPSTSQAPAPATLPHGAADAAKMIWRRLEAR